MTEEAHAIGLVHHLASSEELMPAVYAYAATLANNIAPSSMAVTRQQVYTDLHRDVGSSVVESEILLNQMMVSTDYKEGVKALLEKREPNF
jgi:enoyl-CoA hydratase/carnithine racemase